MAEVCPGGQANCPIDRYVYPGTACTSAADNAGRCFAGECESQQETCSQQYIGSDSVALDASSERCAALNDECTGYLWCTKQGGASSDCLPASPLASGGYAATPTGLACLHASDKHGVRTGFCHDETCMLKEQLAAVPTCGNGGVDYGEQCDCGAATTDPDGCCECATCKLVGGYECATIGYSDGNCCDAGTCSLKAVGVVCRCMEQATHLRTRDHHAKGALLRAQAAPC